MTVDTPPKLIISNKALIDILIDNIIRNIYAHAGSKARITVYQNSIIFENNILGDIDSLEQDVKTSYGIEIVKKLADKCNLEISFIIKLDSYRSVLEFNKF